MTVVRHTAARLALLGALATASAIAPRAAWAQAAQDPSAQARTLFEQGVQLIDERRFAEAITALEASQRLRASPVVTYNLALALRGVGRWRAAIVAFERYLAQPSRSSTPEELAQVRTIVGQLRAGLARLELRLSPADALVRVDGAPPRSVLEPLELDPGSHTIEVSAPTYRTASQTLELAVGARTTLAISLQAEPSLGTLVVEPSEANAAVTIDGEPAGRGTTSRQLSAGAHRVEVSCPQCRSSTRIVRVERSQTVRVAIDVTRSGGGVAPWVIGVGVGAGVAVVATAITVGLVVANSGPAIPEYMGVGGNTWGGNHMLPMQKRTR